MEPKEIANWIGRTLPGVVCKESWGETAWFFNPGGFFANGGYFLTIKQANGPHDRASRLDRDGVWRLGFAMPLDRYEARFGPRPARPLKGGVCDGPWAYDALDRLTPHPLCAWRGWAAINAPSRRRLEDLKPLIRDAHREARARFEARARSGASEAA